MVHGALGKHSEVLDLGLAERRAVVGDENHLGAGAAHRLYGRLVPQRSLSGLHHQLEPGVHRLDGLLLVSREAQEPTELGQQRRASASSPRGIKLLRVLVKQALGEARYLWM